MSFLGLIDVEKKIYLSTLQWGESPLYFPTVCTVKKWGNFGRRDAQAPGSAPDNSMFINETRCKVSSLTIIPPSPQNCLRPRLSWLVALDPNNQTTRLRWGKEKRNSTETIMIITWWACFPCKGYQNSNDDLSGCLLWVPLPAPLSHTGFHQT